MSVGPRIVYSDQKSLTFSVRLVDDLFAKTDKKVPDKQLEHDRIDLLFSSHDEAVRWGRKTLVVQVKRSS